MPDKSENEEHVNIYTCEWESRACKSSRHVGHDYAEQTDVHMQIIRRKQEKKGKRNKRLLSIHKIEEGKERASD